MRHNDAERRRRQRRSRLPHLNGAIKNSRFQFYSILLLRITSRTYIYAHRFYNSADRIHANTLSALIYRRYTSWPADWARGRPTLAPPRNRTRAHGSGTLTEPAAVLLHCTALCGSCGHTHGYSFTGQELERTRWTSTELPRVTLLAPAAWAPPDYYHLPLPGRGVRRGPGMAYGW